MSYFEITDDIKKLIDIFKPYIDENNNLNNNAPDDVKKAYYEFKEKTYLMMEVL